MGRKSSRPTRTQEEDLFDVLGDEGKRYRDLGSRGIRATSGAEKKAEALGIGFEQIAKAVEKGELKASGKDGKLTATDVAGYHKALTKKAEAQDKAKAEAAGKGTKAAQANAEPEVYDRDRIVFYAGHRIDVPTREMKLEEVRAMLEEQFPELTADRAQMIYDSEKGHVIPVLKGHTKGNLASGSEAERSSSEHSSSAVESFIDELRRAGPMEVHLTPPEPPWPPVFHLLGPDGVYEVRQTQAAIVVAKVEARTSLRERFALRVPEIPAHVLQSAIDYFQDAPGEERLLNVVWSDNLGQYGLMAPEQSGSAASVEAAGFVETEDTFIVLQLHSHGTMAAFFSATDDADEVRTGAYGVVGRLDEEIPEVRFRYSCGGRYRDLSAEDLFEEADEGSLEEFVEVLS